MGQHSVELTPELEEDLHRLMRLRGACSESEALLLAVREALERGSTEAMTQDFSAWIGLAKAVPVNPRPRFPSDDDLWR
jgi:hypothetical protein